MTYSPDRSPETSPPNRIPVAQVADLYNELRDEAQAATACLSYLIDYAGVDITGKPTFTELAQFALGRREGLRRALVEIAMLMESPAPDDSSGIE